MEHQEQQEHQEQDLGFELIEINDEMKREVKYNNSNRIPKTQKGKGHNEQSMQRRPSKVKVKMDKMRKKKDDMITLILKEMQKENGCKEAIQKDKKLKDYENSKVISYVRYFRHFADKNPNDKRRKQKMEEQKQEEYKPKQSKGKVSAQDSNSNNEQQEQENYQIQTNVQQFCNDMESTPEGDDYDQGQNIGNTFEEFYDMDFINEHLNTPELAHHNEIEYYEQFDDIPFSQVFGMMIEDAVNELNDIDVVYGQMDCITEQSGETGSIKTNNKMSREQMEKFLVDSILDTIPSEYSGQDSIVSKDIDEQNS